MNQPNSCPLGKSVDSEVLSTNIAFWEDSRISSRPLSANLRTATADNRTDTDDFIPWFAPDNELAQAVAIRKQLYRERPSHILQVNGGLYAAALRLLELQADYLSQNYPEHYTLKSTPDTGKCIVNRATGDEFALNESDLHPLAISGLLGQEDICLVEHTSDGRDVLAAGFVASPTDWSPTKLIGKDMDEIHLPFKDYPQRLKKVVDSTLADLPAFPAMKYRNNLFLGYRPTLALFPVEGDDGMVDADSVADPGEQLSLRSERETLIRLPMDDGDLSRNNIVVFTIKPHVLPLARAAQNLSEGKIAKLIDAIKQNGVRRYNEKLADIAIQYLENYE